MHARRVALFHFTESNLSVVLHMTWTSISPFNSRYKRADWQLAHLNARYELAPDFKLLFSIGRLHRKTCNCYRHVTTRHAAAQCCCKSAPARTSRALPEMAGVHPRAGTHCCTARRVRSRARTRTHAHTHTFRCAPAQCVCRVEGVLHFPWLKSKAA